MQEKKQDLLGAYDEAELIELADSEAFGGTSPATTSSWTCITAATISICPTSACSSKC
ncbi:class II lanthipeptide, LchA2/BrtA2 family [Streptomyces sp. N2-109]|uniref:Class II lanthipeptide, LchA2/BrtA2 family n=1 Tax=Streptomyces gossypii TaxID=2883101 RepID=A0ABT2K3L7_9ACTN|nr:class II lanthipeptide, LchA2/BrtA2 family [Streptomyces gossypii]MCT2594777.1 class II lanthipeptide, LchA2/BrtA2 family [Streptomyces gossypii]